LAWCGLLYYVTVWHYVYGGRSMFVFVDCAVCVA